MKKQVCANVAPGPVPPHAAVKGVPVAKRIAVAPKPVQKKVTAKPKPVEVVDIPSSEEENSSKEKSVHSKKEGDVNSRKKSSRTLTSVLTARSKVC